MFYNLKILITSYPLRIILLKGLSKVLRIKLPKYKRWQRFFDNKCGVEIGGPSALFKKSGYLPVYSTISSLDGVNFSTSTIWEGQLSEGNFFSYGNKSGYQYISEGSFLPNIADGKYDFVLSCNNLEHIANPIAALLEWKRIIKMGGVILLVLPNKKANFDHKRPYTKLDHLIDDFKKDVTEEDTTHLEEILRLHDLRRDPKAGSFNLFKERCLSNFHNRCIHHHVYDQDLLNELFSYCDIEVRLQYSSSSDHFILGVKSGLKIGS